MSIKTKIVKLANQAFLYSLWRLNSPKFMEYQLRYLKSMGMKIEGRPKYISNSVSFDGTGYHLISIGNDTVISSDVRFLTHDYSIMRAAGAVNKIPENVIRVVKPISIGRNCFIGTKSLVMPGTTIGDNVILGAGSVVGGNVPSNMVVAGNPAKPVRTIEEHYNIVMSRDKECIVIEKPNI